MELTFKRIDLTPDYAQHTQRQWIGESADGAQACYILEWHKQTPFVLQREGFSIVGVPGREFSIDAAQYEILRLTVLMLYALDDTDHLDGLILEV